MGEPDSAAAVSLQDKVAFLRRTDSYPDQPARVEAIETHMSWVFLTDHHAYKLKKPIRRTFLDFSSLDGRRRDCEEEVRLNRRLAPEVYLGTLALTESAHGRLQLGGEGQAVDWLVHMRRLPRERMLDAMIAGGQWRAQDIDSLGRLLLEFFRAATPLPFDGPDFLQRFRHDIEANWHDLSAPRYHLPPDTVDPAFRAQLRFLDEHADRLGARGSRVVEGHGDLRPEHICLTEPPVVIDCLEFNPAFRTLDPLDELAFLAMECERLGAAGIGERLVRAYRDASADRATDAVIAFYKVYRACLRAKIAIWHLDDPEIDDHAHWRARTAAYLTLAAQQLPRLAAT